MESMVSSFRSLVAAASTSGAASDAGGGGGGDGGGRGYVTADFCASNRLLGAVFKGLGPAFEFAFSDFLKKVEMLDKVAVQFPDLRSMLDHDVAGGTTKTKDGPTRNLKGVHHGLAFVSTLFDLMLGERSDGVEGKPPALKACAEEAYAKELAPFHNFVVRTAVAGAMLLVPHREQFLKDFGETEDSFRAHAEALPGLTRSVVADLEALYASKGVPIDW